MEHYEEMRQYIHRTAIKNAGRFCLCLNDMDVIHDVWAYNPVEAIHLAFQYGRAKGYRAAKAEVRK